MTKHQDQRDMFSPDSAACRNLETVNAELRRDLEGMTLQCQELTRTIEAAAKGSIALRNKEPKDLPHAFLAIALGYWGRGATPAAAINEMCNAGAKRDQAFTLLCFVGDDKPSVINGGLNISQAAGSMRLECGRFMSVRHWLNATRPD